MSDTKKLTIRVTPEQFEAIISMQADLRINTMSQAIVFAACSHEDLSGQFEDKCDENAALRAELNGLSQMIKSANAIIKKIVARAHDSNL